MAGIGFDGSVVERVGTARKKLLGKGAYLVSALQQLMFWEQEKLMIIGNGAENKCHSIIICNAAHYGGAFRLAPGADISSPLFEVICIRSDQRRAYLKLAINVLTGKKIFQEEIVRFTAQDITVAGSKAIQIDGDFFGHSPVTIRMVSDYARVIV